MFGTLCAWLVGRVGYLLYTLAVLVVCLWLLFPGRTARELLVRALNTAAPQLDWRVETITGELPGVLHLAGMEGHELGRGGDPVLRVDSLTLRPDLVTLVRQRLLQVAWRLEMAGGAVHGQLYLPRPGSELRVEGVMEGVRLAELVILEHRLQRGLQGTAAADFTATVHSVPLSLTGLSATARVEDGRIDLKQPVLGHGFVPFGRVEVSLSLQDERLELTDGAVDSNLFTGTFTGDLRLGHDPATSQMTLTGSLQPRPEFFSAAGGDSVALQAIRARLRDRSLPFRISGELSNPDVHFEEFSMLFDALSTESR
ncbi:MAG: type II secretion system protein GspN [Desulfobulbus sp.]|jgi:type II secretion system protein N|nr:type II secretion system protein GspN [Desulfobulbus sp.]